MSDFLSKDLLPQLWDEILQRHWNFLETEDGIQKIEERKKLESCLKDFLCLVRHDRKFFLPETAQVLQQTVREMPDFSAYEAMLGFEAVSQYANNLFTKPWREEYRILKTYSGFYQHEIKSNLYNAVKLFEAMGYRRLSDEILVLDGPICPDQVTNVSRDAMAAYVECKIMKNIYAGLKTAGIKCTWQDVFNYRKKCVGGTSQAIKELAYALQERQHHKENLLIDSSGYATIQHHLSSIDAVPPAPPPPPKRSQCPTCTTYQHTFVKTSQQQQQPCALHYNPLQSACALHPTKGMSNSSNKMYTSYPTTTTAAFNNSHMPHSRSFEHYNEPPPLLPQRHSFDHQQQGCSAHQSHYQVPRSQHTPYTTSHQHQHLYESPYDSLERDDCLSSGLQALDSLDSGSASYAAISASNSHPYNVSGNRYPLPYNISNQLNSHYSTPSAVTCSVRGMYDAYAAADNIYATVLKPTTSYRSAQKRSPLPED